MRFLSSQKQSMKLFVTSLCIGFSMLSIGTATSEDTVFDQPILIVGASFDNGPSPISDDLGGPIGGATVSLGNYLSIGAALVRDPLTKGLFINEARGGAGTFKRPGCAGAVCSPYEWQSFATQLEKALLRVAIRNPENPSEITGYNARYMTLGIPNDCLHSDAEGVLQSESTPCTSDDINATVDRLKAVAERALAVNITPVIHLYPDFADFDLSLTQTLFNFVWVIDETTYNELKETHQSRLAAELPAAIFVEGGWDGFKHIGDGLHPDRDAAIHAAHRTALTIKQHAWQQTQSSPAPKLEVTFNKSVYQTGDRFSFNLATYAPEDEDVYDLYAALIFPEGYFVTFGNHQFAMHFPGTIMPYQTQVTLQTLQYSTVTDITLARGISAGEYTGCGILTPAGTDPWEPDNRAALVCETFTVTDES